MCAALFCNFHPKNYKPWNQNRKANWPAGKNPPGNRHPLPAGSALYSPLHFMILFIITVITIPVELFKGFRDLTREPEKV